MITIEIENNNTCKLSGNPLEMKQLYQGMKVREPNAFYLRKYMPKGWDGKIDYIRPNGRFKTGLLERVGAKCDSLGIEWDLWDNRKQVDTLKPKLVLSTKNWKARDYQGDAVKAVLNSKVKDVVLPRCMIKVATNGGKTTITSFIYKSYNQPTIYLMNSKELFEQSLKEIPLIIGEPVGQISSKKIEWAPFMVCMVGTLRNRVSTILNELSKYRVLIVDECDLADNKTNKKVIESLYNTIVRVGMSGTIGMTTLKKDLPKQTNLESFFGPIKYEITNRDLIDKGVSSEVAVTFIEGNTNPLDEGSWQDEMEEGIVHNKARNIKIFKRCGLHYKAGRDIQLVIVQRHDHIKNLLKLVKVAKKKGVIPKDATVDWVHHARKDRDDVVDRFEKGEINILIGSMILKRGKNFPLMTYMLNAGGGKSIENVNQLLGRAFRGAKHFEDFFDLGKYLKPWSRKRAIYYKNQQIKVTNKFR